MPIAPYGGIVFAAMAAVGGALQAGDPGGDFRETALAGGAPENVNGVQTLCAPAEQVGLISPDGQDGLNDYTLRLAVLDSDGNFLPQTHIQITGADPAAAPLRLRCAADWVLFEVKPGHYTVKAEQNGQIRYAAVDIPEHGHVRVALTMGDILTASLGPHAG